LKKPIQKKNFTTMDASTTTANNCDELEYPVINAGVAETRQEVEEGEVTETQDVTIETLLEEVPEVAEKVREYLGEEGELFIMQVDDDDFNPVLNTNTNAESGQKEDTKTSPKKVEKKSCSGSCHHEKHAEATRKAERKTEKKEA
jgi:hypothetical protein